METIRRLFVIGTCLWVLGCRGADEQPHPILGSHAKNIAPGPHALTASQTRALQTAITSSGEPCAAISQTYLRDVDRQLGTETWNVRCADGAYSVRIAANSEHAVVQPCFVGSFRGDRGDPCFRGFPGPSESAPPRLNPELGKLLAPMSGEGTKKGD